MYYLYNFMYMKMKIIILFIISAFTFFDISAQNVVSVVNSTNTVKITYDDGSLNVCPKRGAKITNPSSGTIIYFTDINMKTYIIDFSLITSPIAVNKDALALVISNYLN